MKRLVWIYYSKHKFGFSSKIVLALRIAIARGKTITLLGHSYLLIFFILFVLCRVALPVRVMRIWREC
jgi:hypothetical protein